MMRFVTSLLLLMCLSTASNASGPGAVVWTKEDGSWRIGHPAYANQPEWVRPAIPESRRIALPDADRYLAMGDEQLRALADERGVSRHTTNILARDVAYVLARRWADTGDKNAAHKSAVVLYRLAEVFPKWPFYDRRGNPTPHNEKPPYSGSMWGTNWYYYDLERCVNLAMTWDLLQGSDAIEALGPGAHEKIERDLMRANIHIYTDRYPRIFSNVDGNLFNGLMIWGLCLGDPELIHKTIRWIDEFYRVSFYGSGAWHESTSSYHLMICCRLDQFIRNNPLKGYSDPPGWTDPVDGTRFDDLQLEERYGADLDRAAAILRGMLLPNGRFVGVHDAAFTDSTARVAGEPYLPPDIRNYVPSEQRPYIVYDFGHAILAGGRGTDQSQAHLHFSGNHGHDHLDNLSMILFANEKELFSETQYHASRGSSRGWQSSTAAHSTVVIDEQNQVGMRNARRRVMDPVLDAANAEDYPLSGTVRFSYTDANLQLYEVSDRSVQVVEASAENAYWPVTQTYRRTLARIEMGGPDFYVVDLFRVKGGKVHDWMLHGNLEEEYKLQTKFPLEPTSMTLHGDIHIASAARTDGQLGFRFVAPDHSMVNTIVVGAEGTQVMIGDGPAMRREGTAPFLDIRRAGPSNIFAAIHEPFTIDPTVRTITRLPSSPDAVALKIGFANHADYFLSTMAPDEKLIVDDGTTHIELTGRIGYISLRDGKVCKLCLIDGSRLEANGRKVTAKPLDGEVIGSMCESEGDKANAFIVKGKITEGDALKGRTIILTDGEGMTHGFEIACVERGPGWGKSRVILADDPFVRIENGVYKMLRFPSWGIRGKVTYHIAGAAIK